MVLAVVEREGLGQRALQALGDDHRVAAVVDVLAEDHELVAPEACHRVDRTEGRVEPRSDRLEQSVAGVVAEAVVDQLEVVDVEEHHGGVRMAGIAPGEHVPEAVEEKCAVGEAGERVVESVVAKRLLRAPALDGGTEHVGHGLHEERIVIGEVPGLTCVPAQHAERQPRPRDRHADAAGEAGARQRLGQPEAVLGRVVGDDHRCVGLESEGGLHGCLVSNAQVPGAVRQDARGRRQLEVPGELRRLPDLAKIEGQVLGEETKRLVDEAREGQPLQPASTKLGNGRLPHGPRPDLALAALAIGYVDAGRDHVIGRPVFVSYENCRERDQPPLAVARDHVNLELARAAVLQQRIPLAPPVLGLVGHEDL